MRLIKYRWPEDNPRLGPAPAFAFVVRGRRSGWARVELVVAGRGFALTLPSDAGR